MSDQDTFERIVAAVHEAALDPAYWAEATHRIDDACGLLAGHLAFYDTKTDPPTYLFSAMYSHGEDHNTRIAEYTDDAYFIDERVPNIFRQPLNRFHTNAEMYPEGTLKTSVVYNEVLPRLGSNNQLGVRLAGPAGTEITWGPSKPAGWDWPAAHVTLLHACLPLLRHSLHVHHALVSAEVASPSLASLLDTRQIGAIFLDQRGQLLAVNDRASDLLRHDPRLSDQGGVLAARPSTANARLGKLLARALRGRPPVGGSMTLKRKTGLPPLILHISPVTTPRTLFGACALPVLVLLLDPSVPPALDAKLIASAFGLTPAESEVAVALAQGHTVRAIAALSYRQESSVRWLLKQVHAKLGVTQRADVIRRVLSLAGLRHA